MPSFDAGMVELDRLTRRFERRSDLTQFGELEGEMVLR